MALTIWVLGHGPKLAPKFKIGIGSIACNFNSGPLGIQVPIRIPS